MRFKVIFVAVLVMTAALLCLPSLAACGPFGGGGGFQSSGSWNNCIILLADRACQGSAAMKNGCYGYLEGRFKCNSPGGALSWCVSNRCGHWYAGPDKTGAKKVCEEGCQFLKNRE